MTVLFLIKLLCYRLNHHQLRYRKSKEKNTQTDFIASFPKRDQRIFSVEETILKQEEDLILARKTIKNLQSQLGTVIVTEESESDDGVSMHGEEDVQVEVDQEDAFFAHQHTFKTNVRKMRYLP